MVQNERFVNCFVRLLPENRKISSAFPSAKLRWLNVNINYVKTLKKIQGAKKY